MPDETVDTGEFLVPEVGYQRAMIYNKAQERRIRELEAMVRKLAGRIHRRAHDITVPMKRCRMAICQEVELTLGRHTTTTTTTPP